MKEEARQLLHLDISIDLKTDNFSLDITVIGIA
jgi:hypothetical protein